MSRDAAVTGAVMVALAGLLTPVSGTGQQIEGRVLLRGTPARNAVVYLVDVEPVVPPLDPVVVDQRHLRFVPGTVVVAPGTRVEFLNSDPVLHNVFSPGRETEGFDLGWYPRSESRPHVFRLQGWYVILCHVHPEMLANVVVVPSNHGVATDRDGAFRFEGLPPGRYEVRVWYPPLQDVAVRTLDLGTESLSLEIDLAQVRGAARPPATNRAGG